jgi:hypothetical protein
VGGSARGGWACTWTRTRTRRFARAVTRSCLSRWATPPTLPTGHAISASTLTGYLSARNHRRTPPTSSNHKCVAMLLPCSRCCSVCDHAASLARCLLDGHRITTRRHMTLTHAHIHLISSHHITSHHTVATHPPHDRRLGLGLAGGAAGEWRSAGLWWAVEDDPPRRERHRAAQPPSVAPHGARPAQLHIPQHRTRRSVLRRLPRTNGHTCNSLSDVWCTSV